MMKNAFLVGERVYLRAVSLADIDGPYFDWLNDESVTQFTESGRFPNSRAAMEEFIRSADAGHESVLFAIVEKQTDRHIGNVKLGPIQWIHRLAEYGILIGERGFWGQGVGTEVTRLVLNYAFRRLNLNKVILGVAGLHSGAIKAYERCGFVIEGRLKNAIFIDGKYTDKLYMGILAEAFLDKDSE